MTKREMIVETLQISRTMIGTWRAYYLCSSLTHQLQRLHAKVDPNPQEWMQIKIIWGLKRVIEDRLGGHLSLEGWMRANHPHLVEHIVRGGQLPRAARLDWLDGLIAEAKAGGFDAL